MEGMQFSALIGGIGDMETNAVIVARHTSVHLILCCALIGRIPDRNSRERSFCTS